MSTCQYCGQEIEFRHIDGKVRPIHPDGGWHCGTWAHSESSSSSAFHHEARTWQHTNFTRPTKCPKCRRDVFFIRHNDGSVWVDELGWPWPKHECFDQPHAGASAFDGWSKQLAKFKNPNGGVVTCIRPSTSGESHFIEVTMGSAEKIGFFLAWIPPQESLLGALVVISRQDHLLIHPVHGEIAMRNVVDLGPRSGAKQLAACSIVGSALPHHTKAEDHEVQIVCEVKGISG